MEWVVSSIELMTRKESDETIISPRIFKSSHLHSTPNVVERVEISPFEDHVSLSACCPSSTEALEVIDHLSFMETSTGALSRNMSRYGHCDKELEAVTRRAKSGFGGKESGYL